MKTLIETAEWSLVDQYGFPVSEGDEVKSSRGAMHLLTGGDPPLVAGGVGTVSSNYNRASHPSAYKLQWIPKTKK